MPANSNNLSRSEFISNYMLTAEGYPLSMEMMPWWREIYNREFENWHHTIITAGRQSGKSTQNIVNSSLDLLIPNTTIIYAMPTDTQALELSKTKFAPIWGNANFRKPKFITDSVHEKTLINNSTLLFKYLYGGRKASIARGTTASALYLDELQSIVSDQIPIIQETLSFRHYEGEIKWQTFSGTHLSRLSAPNIYWEKSTMREWYLQCPHCGKWNFPNEDIIGDNGLICLKCGKSLKPPLGQWVRTGSKDALWEGFRIPPNTVSVYTV